MTGPLMFLRLAAARVRAVRYAYGAAGIAAAGALIVLFLGYSKAAVIIWACTFVSMVLLVVFSNIAGGRDPALKFPGLVLAYVVTLFFCIFLGFTVTAFAVSWPENWANFLDIRPVQKTTPFSMAGPVSRFGCERGGQSEVTFSAPPGTIILNAVAATSDVGDAKAANASIIARNDHSATARADFFGRDREWTGNCPSGGHGQVTISGEIVTVPAVPSAFALIAFLMATGAVLVGIGFLASLRREAPPPDPRGGLPVAS